jgi:NADH-quinone oxidoreductase subunit F
METPLTQNIRIGGEPPDRQAYERAGGYQALRKALRSMTPNEVIETVKDSNLRGRGGAGFPSGLKWSFVSKNAPHPRYLVANADEMEPGTFKDRVLMEGDPHQFIEGIALAAYATGTDVAYIFLRAEYKLAAARIARAIAEAYAANYRGRNILGADYSLDLYLHISAGRYMCGEETGMLNALEGKRANPRSKPPYPPAAGLWGKPTTINNVETLCNVPHIVNRGAEWFRKLSRTKDGGTKLYGASGKVRRPGLWELPMGTTAREILEEHAGGMREGLRCRGVLPGGASTDFLTEQHFDIPMDF